jgi:hypothetical protein
MLNKGIMNRSLGSLLAVLLLLGGLAVPALAHAQDAAQDEAQDEAQEIRRRMRHRMKHRRSARC